MQSIVWFINCAIRTNRIKLCAGSYNKLEILLFGKRTSLTLGPVANRIAISCCKNQQKEENFHKSTYIGKIREAWLK